MKLNEYLQRRGMNVVDFCKLKNIPRSTVYTILKGDVIPRLNTAMLVYIATEGEVNFFDMLPDFCMGEIAEKVKKHSFYVDDIGQNVQ